MILRNLKTQDVKEIERFLDGKDYPWNPNCVSSKVVEDEKGIIAAGQIVVFSELVLVMDKERSKGERVSALKELMLQSMHETSKLGIHQVHTFVRDEKFARILEKHWGFKKSEGEVLYLNV